MKKFDIRPCATGMGKVSPFLFGNNLEHTRSSIYRGLSAQMLRNRKFSGKPSAMEGVAGEWFLIGDRTYAIIHAPYAHHYPGHYHMNRQLETGAQHLMCCDPEKEGGFGQHEIDISDKETYLFAVVAKCEKDVEITVSLTDRYGKKTYAEKKIAISGGDEWKRYETELSCTESDCDASLRLVFKKRVCLCIGSMSLMNKDNFHGMRKDVVKLMKEMGIKILRWPGGNFAGEYNWFDGLLPADERSPLLSYLGLETQPHSLGFDGHDINTDDFIALCREIGAEPFITINPTWCTPEENAAWVEYCNGDENTEYGRIRAERGHREPYNVRYWSLGNEFGYGHMEGDNTAKGYARLARNQAEKMLAVSPDLILCSSGPYPNKEWVENSALPLSDIVEYVSYHTYSPEPVFEKDADIEKRYLASLKNVKNAEDCLKTMREWLGDKVKISFDEWNLWYAWYRKSSVPDGMHAAMMLTMIIGQAPLSDVGIACNFEAVNEGAIKVYPHNAEFTATGKMIKLMTEHMNGELLYADDFTVMTEKDGIKTVTAVNPSVGEDAVFSIEADGKPFEAALYEGKEIMPVSDFEEKGPDISAENGSISLKLSPLSVAIIKIH
jgi:alpha-N-arabinofuranosidase